MKAGILTGVMVSSGLGYLLASRTDNVGAKLVLIVLSGLAGYGIAATDWK